MINEAEFKKISSKVATLENQISTILEHISHLKNLIYDTNLNFASHFRQHADRDSLIKQKFIELSKIINKILDEKNDN